MLARQNKTDLLLEQSLLVVVVHNATDRKTKVQVLPEMNLRKGSMVKVIFSYCDFKEK